MLRKTDLTANASSARGGEDSSVASLRLVSRQKGAAQALALARQKLASAKAADLPEECIGILEDKVHQEETEFKKRSALVTGDGPSQGQIPPSCREWGESKGHDVQSTSVFRAGAPGCVAGPGGPRKAHAGNPFASLFGPTCQCKPCQHLGSFDRSSREHVGPRRGATTGAPGADDPGVEGINSDLFGPSGPEGSCCIWM